MYTWFTKNLLGQAEFAAERLANAIEEYDEGYWTGMFYACARAWEEASRNDERAVERLTTVRRLMNSNFEILSPELV